MRLRDAVFIATFLIAAGGYGLGWLFGADWLLWIGGAAFAVNTVALFLVAFSGKESGRAHR